MKRFIVSAMLCLLCGCAVHGERQTPLVLEYGDFGPQCVAYELLGLEVNSWVGMPSEDDTNDTPIKVVVYEGPDADARKCYPIIVERSDYRYVRADRAVAFLDEKSRECRELMREAEVEGPDAKDGSYESFEILAAKLASSRDRITLHFGRH